MPTKTDPALGFEKIPDTEPIFPLRAQDATADLLVDAWGDVQRFLARELAHGLSLEAVRAEIRDRLEGLFEAGELTGSTTKISGAYACAAQMRQWANRKPAD